MKTIHGAEYGSSGFSYTDILRYKIRRAKEPDNPKLLAEFFRLDAAPSDEPLEKKRVRFLKQFQLLLDAIEDATNARHWREHCLNNINRPIGSLALLINCADSRSEVNALFARIRQIKIA